MNDEIKKYVIPAFVISITVVLLVGFYFVYKNYIEEDSYEEIEKYEVNQVYPIYITEDQMANIYLSDFNYLMFNNVEEAYQKLNKEYAQKKFGSLDNFKNYVNSLGNITIKSFATKNAKGYEYFYIYDNKNNLYIFRTKGVMQYEVFLDETTTEV